MKIDRSLAIALGIAVIAAAWILSGQLIPSEAHEIEAARPAPPVSGAPQQMRADGPIAASPQVAGRGPAAGGPTVVRVRTLRAESQQADVTLRGHTEAERKVEVKAETAGAVAAVPAQEGSTVRTGDLLCELEVDSRAAMLNQARAHMREAELKYQGSLALSQKGYQSDTAVATDLAGYQGAKAEVERMQEELENTRIRAPFDGVVDRRMVEVGDYMNVGSPCALVLDEDPFLVIAHVSEREVGSLAVGDAGEARLITGETVLGKIRFLSKTADPSTRTFRVELEVPNPDRSLRDGITAEIRIATRTVEAHRISPAILALDDTGRVGVRIVEQGVVQFVPVSIVSDGKSGVWVTGLPQTVTVITVGQEYVNEGQPVHTVEDGPEGAS